MANQAPIAAAGGIEPVMAVLRTRVERGVPHCACRVLTLLSDSSLERKAMIKSGGGVALADEANRLHSGD